MYMLSLHFNFLGLIHGWVLQRECNDYLREKGLHSPIQGFV